jgi:hypothetical protein
LSINQITGYVQRTCRLIDAREAFAQDVLDRNSAKTSQDVSVTRDGWTYTVRRIPGILWGEVNVIDERRSSRPYTVEVTEGLRQGHAEPSAEKWAMHLYGATNGAVPPERTRENAEREGIHAEKDETYLQLFPRVERELRSKEAEFPGTGVSLHLGTFAFLAPFAVFGTLVVLDFRIRSALQVSSSDADSWILLDARSGLAGFLAHLWLAAIAVGPWLLSILVVDAVSLFIRAEGIRSVLPLVLAGGYVVFVIVILLSSTTSVLLGLGSLRSRVVKTVPAAEH